MFTPTSPDFSTTEFYRNYVITTIMVKIFGNFETTSDPFSSIKSLRMEEFQHASFDIDFPQS